MLKMRDQRHIFLLTYMVALAAPLSLAFNIDATNPDVYAGERKDFFGYKVLQFTSGTDKGIIVTAPLQLNGSGGVCRPYKNQSTQCFNAEDITVKDETLPVKLLGLSIATDSTSSQFIVCSPSVAHECNENSYLNTVCYNMTYSLQTISSFTPAFQECTKKTVDLVFLVDGSGSMTGAEFRKNKDFIVDIMASLKNTSIKFSAVQFSSNNRKVFDFNDYQDGSALKKLKEEPHMEDLTNTHGALEFVMINILENQTAGASPDAIKVLVIITDGDPSDRDNGIIKKYDKKHIIRFVIGVKEATLEKFTAIASKPAEDYAFKIENYNGLKGILEKFQKRIFKMEGSSVARGGDLKEEMAQSGFSAVFYNNTLILGSVGSKSWGGSLQEIHEGKETQIEDPPMKKDSYMGYSISVGKRDNASLYFAGAPRFEHTGQVLLFRRDGGNWAAAQSLNGTQIGSYFGAELCSVDIDSDGNTDFLLVGAPLFYQPHEKKEGRIYVYILSEEMQLEIVLSVTASMGRFGTTISSLADLNGDELRDVAVGAPLEDDNRGAVYIYLGDRRNGIRSHFSQRIMGQEIRHEMRFFGQAIDGGIDLGEDGLPDILIGSQGIAVVLRCRPVFNVTAHLSFLPKEISTEEINCVDQTDESLPMGILHVCFEMVENTKSKADVMSSGLNISYMLNVDPVRQTYRGFFGNDKKARSLTSSCNLTANETCLQLPVNMPKCLKDTFSPITIKFNFSQVDSESASAVLNVDSSRSASVEVPFEKQCAKNDNCVAELEVDFNFTTPALLVAEDSYFNVTVKLSNYGDDSYNTSLTMHYPPGLSFSRMIINESTRPTLHSCHDLDGVLDKTVCGVSLPVYRSRSAVTFITTFLIMPEYKWNDTIVMTVTGRSDNANITENNTLTKSLPVQFEIKMGLTVKEGTTTYLNFTAEEAAPKKMEIIYQIDNPGFKAFPVNVSLFFPTQLEHNFEMKDYQVFVQQNKTQCRLPDLKDDHCSPEERHKIIECDTFILDKESSTEFTLSGEAHFRDLEKHAENNAFLKRYTGDSGEVKFKSSIGVEFDGRHYVLVSRKKERKDGFMETSHKSCSWKDNDPTMKWSEVRVEFIILPNRLLIILTGVGLGLLFLIITTIIMCKLGCFKRKTFYEEDETDAVLQADSSYDFAFDPRAVSQLETEGKSDKPSEEKSLLVDDEAKGSIAVADEEEGLEYK
ncbi:integrin alpha-M-like [Limanda limanda]|uniref:integrin alpha-M-like n=1 Tax=Limanda limanda TaxID=27771 RepID=UPI0029C68B74|nr:integrin alpha-M-like [Limanda limanda]